eukprot:7379352-Prymnesium_polylepis.1
MVRVAAAWAWAEAARAQAAVMTSQAAAVSMPAVGCGCVGMGAPEGAHHHGCAGAGCASWVHLTPRFTVIPQSRQRPK